jgi:hypothetical protein
MFIDMVIFEGCSCSGKSWMMSKVNKESNFKWCLVDRGNISGVIENKRRGRDNWKNREGMLKRNLNDGMGIVYIIVDSEWNIIKERFEKRGDDIVENVEELKSEFDSWEEYYNENEWLKNNIKVKKVKDWKECISYLRWLENNVSDNRSFKFGRSNSEMEKKYNEYDRWNKLKENVFFDFEILEEDYKNMNNIKVEFK